MGNLSNLYISQSYQSLIHLGSDNTASSTLVGLQDGLGNSIGISVNTSGSLSISGSFTASLANGYAWVGDGNNKTSLVPTSSFGSVTSAITGSSLITASFSGNTLTFTKGNNTTFGVVIPDVSGSGPTDISALNAFTASQYTINSAIGASTASLNAYTSSVDTKFIAVGSSTASLNSFTSSQNTKNSTLATYTASIDTKFSTIGTQSGSWDNTALNSFTQSQDTKNSTLGGVTASLNTSASLAIYTASFNTGTRDLTFTKGNTTQFSVNIPDVSGSTTDLGPLNAFTASQEILNTTFATTGSNTFKGANTFELNVAAQNGFTTIGQTIFGDGQILNTISVENVSGSLVFNKIASATKVDLKNLSLLVSGTFTSSLQQGYVWVGDSNGKTTTVPTSSFGSNINTGSFATTGSNTFTGSQIINVDGYPNASFDFSGGIQFFQAVQFNNNASATFNNVSYFNGSVYLSSAIRDQATDGDNLNIASSGDVRFQNLSASLQEGYVWVGNSSNRNVLVPTSSFVSTPTDISSLNAFTSSQNTKNSTLATYTGSNDTKWSNLGSQSGSFVTESETGSFARTNVDNNFSANQTFTNITAVSASFTYVQTLYETSSVIYSSGSNQFGDELSDIQTLSGSVKIQGSLTINGTPVQTSSVDISSLNAFTQSQDTKNNTLGSYTASVDTKFVAVGSSTASLNSYTQSQDTKNSTLATYTGSNDTKWNTLGGQTGSYVTSGITGSSLVTASVSLNTITFTKGDATTFNVTVNTGSAVTTDISALNSFTQSQDTKNSTLASYTASVDTKFSTIGTQSGSWDNTSLNSFTQSVDAKFTAVGSSTASLNAYTQSNDTKWNTLGGLTGSYVTSAITGSSLVTASFSGNTLTFTKGDSSTFGVIIPDVSGSTINTGSFATTGSNQFTGNQAIDGTLTITGKIIGSQSLILQPDANDARTLEIYNTSPADTHITASGGELYLGNDETYVLVNTYANQKLVTIRGDQGIAASGSLSISGSLTASLQQGYVWVGDGNNRTQLVPTSSFAGGSTNTGSLMVTGSVVGNVLTFTKGDASQFSLTVATGSGGGGSTDTGSLLVTASFDTSTRNITFTKGDATGFNISGFATTGSNTGNNRFVGEQQITSSLNALTILGYGKRLNFGDTLQQADTARLFLAESDGTNQGTLLSFTGANSGLSFAVADTATPSTGSTRISFINESRSGSILFQNSANTGEIKFDNVTGSIQMSAGSNITISGSSTTIQNVNFLPFSQSLNSRILAVTGSSLITGSVSGNVLTFTKGDASTFTLTVATGSGGGSTIDTGSFATTGSNTFVGAQTLNGNGNVVSGSITFNGTSVFNNTASLFNSIKLNNSIFGATNALQIDVASGSIVLQSPTGVGGLSGLSHLSASSPNGLVNLVFKRDGSNGDTIISGSNNIFSNPATPTTGYKRYIGGNNNLYLNNSNGINTQVTASATTVSGAMPVMNNNIFNGTGNFSINQAPNTGTHTYSQNIIGGTGTTTINALGFTGSLNLLSNFNNNGTITINAASASTAEIASGLSGSGTVTVNSNGIFGGSITATSPRILLTTNTQTVSSNVIAGSSITITNISGSANVNASNNITNGAISYTNASATGVHTSAGQVNNSQGAFTVTAIGSAVSIANALSLGGPSITNLSFSGSAGAGLMSANRNLFQGQAHSLLVTGSLGTASNVNFSDNTILGKTNTIFANVTGAGNYRDLNAIVIGGQNLIVTASNSFALTEGGGAHLGRYNANDGIRNKTGEIVLSVGTGTSTTRKTGFLIDSGSNTFVEGTLNVSGSTTLSGSLYIQSGSTLPAATGSSVLTWNSATGQVSQSPIATLISSSFSVGAFNSTITQSGSAAVSQSMTFNNTDISNGITLNGGGTQLTIANSGTYNIQFSAQLLADTGADTIWIWLKKNGTNVSNTATKLVLANNEANVAAWNFVVPAVGTDYFELVWQNNGGHTKLLTETASGNYPAIPSVIVTVTQVE